MPRPHNLLDLLKAKYTGQPYDESKLNSVLAREVAECVRKQVECGIEIVTDGEYSKPGFFTYIRERFDGFESGLIRSSSLSLSANTGHWPLPLICKRDVL